MSPAPLLLPQVDVGDGIVTLAVDPKLVEVPVSAVLRELGYTNEDADRYFIDITESLVSHLPQRIDVHAACRIVSICHPDSTVDGIEIADGIILRTGPIVASQLRGATDVALFACTIGTAMEDYIRERMTRGEVLEGHFADVAASLAAEKVASLVHGHIAAVMQARGQGVTNRFSPGYCGWSVGQQQELFSLLPGQYCGITLSSSSLMAPVKSVSGIVGTGSGVKWESYRCATCGRKNCTYRTYRSEREKRVPLL